MAEAVLDSSAVLAVLYDEPGADIARRVIANSIMSSVNYAETLGRMLDEGVPAGHAEDYLLRLELAVIPADAADARAAGLMVEKTRRTGTSLADRFFLALAKNTGLPAMTTDRRLARLDVGVEVRLIR